MRVAAVRRRRRRVTDRVSTRKVLHDNSKLRSCYGAIAGIVRVSREKKSVPETRRRRDFVVFDFFFFDFFAVIIFARIHRVCALSFDTTR